MAGFNWTRDQADQAMALLLVVKRSRHRFDELEFVDTSAMSIGARREHFRKCDDAAAKAASAIKAVELFADGLGGS